MDAMGANGFAMAGDQSVCGQVLKTVDRRGDAAVTRIEHGGQLLWSGADARQGMSGDQRVTAEQDTGRGHQVAGVAASMAGGGHGNEATRQS